MDFNIKTGQPEKQRTDCLIFPVFEQGKLDELAQVFDKHCHGALSKLVKMGDVTGTAGTFNIIPSPTAEVERVLLIGCGKQAEFDERKYRDAIKNMACALKQTGATEACCFLTMLNVKDRDSNWKIQQATMLAANSEYNFTEYKSATDKKPKGIKKITWFVGNKRDADKGATAIAAGLAIANAMATTKDLANTPPNICTPTYMSKQAEKIAKKFKKINCAILDRKDLESLKMGAFLSVTAGSAQPPKLITLEYCGADKKQPPIVLVGKGITFDTGGTSLKPPDKMIGMKFDMSGAATVLGMIQFAAEMHLPINLVGLLAMAENMPGSTASRPEDIVTTMSGQTVEILNTDAEGRLVLCDTLTYCERFKPKLVIDMATLTGACVVALGAFHSGLFSNHQPLADALLKAGQISGDKCWQLPLTEDYMPLLESTYADFSNVGGPEGGAITAACFLSKFTSKFHWAHLDIAGTAARYTGKDRGATGQPIPLLAEFLLGQR